MAMWLVPLCGFAQSRVEAPMWGPRQVFSSLMSPSQAKVTELPAAVVLGHCFSFLPPKTSGNEVHCFSPILQLPFACIKVLQSVKRQLMDFLQGEKKKNPQPINKW